jgi:hypothetical protein
VTGNPSKPVKGSTPASGASVPVGSSVQLTTQ